MRTILTIMAVALFVCVVPVQGKEPVVSVRATGPAGSLQPGQAAVLTVEVKISPPYHINSDRPLQDYLIPTTLELGPQQSLTFGEPIFPPAPVKKLPVADSPMAVYEGTVKIAVEIMPAAGLSVKAVKIDGKVNYQACNDRYCLPPAAQAFSLTIPVAASAREISPPSKSMEMGQRMDTSRVGANSARTKDSAAVEFGNKGLLPTFFLVFLGGLALNLTPCVYPMIPITITYFGGQAQGKKGSIIAHSCLYVVGMAVTYSILGVMAAKTGSLFGAALQYPPVLVGITLVMVVLALSMFDVYELRMPQFLNRFAGSSQKGFWGTLLMGLTVGIVAAPCIGPFVLGLLTYVGNRGNIFLGFALFFVLALGLGVPFLVLGVFSGSIRRLPRSGAWMVWVRKIFGFILLAMAVYFVKPLFPIPLAFDLTLALILLLGGIYLAWIDTVPGTGKVFSYARNMIGIVFFASALYAAVTGLETNLETAQDRSSSINPARTIQWLPYSESVMNRAALDAKPVFLDFYADWCAPCKELDNSTFADPEVVQRSKEFFMMKVDLTSTSDPQAEILRKKYQARGVPTLVFLRPDGQEIESLRGAGFEPKEEFLRKMDDALRLSSGVQRRSMSSKAEEF